MNFRCVVGVLASILAACTQQTPKFHESGFPERLSDWRLMTAEGGALRLSRTAHPYDLATPLFSDYALKVRTITLPKGEAAVYDPDNAFDLPVGTILSKTFYYPQTGAEWTGDVGYGAAPIAVDGALVLDGLRLIETRLLVRRAEGWVGIPYVWNDAQTDAVLKRTGEIKKLRLHRPDGRVESLSYLVPDQNQCAGCHAGAGEALAPIGIKARHLNKPSSFFRGLNQLEHWTEGGLLRGAPAHTAPGNASWTDEKASLDARARAYLDANCSHCHSDIGPADHSGLDLRPGVAFGPALGVCKSPIAAGAGSGGRAYDIVPGGPAESIAVFRMETTAPGAMMPELGRAVTDEEGVKLISDWIAAMEGGCG